MLHALATTSLIRLSEIYTKVAESEFVVEPDRLLTTTRGLDFLHNRAKVIFLLLIFSLKAYISVKVNVIITFQSCTT